MEYRKDIYIRCKDDGKEYIVTELVKPALGELVNRRIFDSHKDAEYTLLALSRGSVYALEHGLACPADFKRAVKKIKSLPTYERGVM